MSVDAPSDRTARRLALRLEELAHAVEGAGMRPGEAQPLIELAAVATMHAVTLELLTLERASEIWSAAAERHPTLDDGGARSARARLQRS